MSNSPDKINGEAIQNAIAYTIQLKTEAALVSKALEILLIQQKDLEFAGKQNSKLFQDVSSKIRLTKQSLEETTKQIDANVKSFKELKNSLEQNQGLLKNLRAQYNELAKTKGSDTKETKELSKQVESLTGLVTNQKVAFEKSKEKLDFHKISVDALQSSSEKLKKSNKDFGPILSDVTDGFNMMKNGLSFVKVGFQGVGGAIKTTGFGLLLLVLQSVVEYFTNTTEGAKKLQSILSAVGVVVDIFKQGLASLGKIFVDAFTNPVENIKKLGQALVDNVINRFKGLLVIWDGVKSMDFKKISNGILQTATGVTNVADKAVQAYIKVSNEAKATEAVNKTVHENEKKRSGERIHMHKKEAAAKTENLKTAPTSNDNERGEELTLSRDKEVDTTPQLPDLLSLEAQKKSEKAAAQNPQQQIDEVEQSGHHSKALQMQIDLLNSDYQISIDAARKKGEDTTKIEADYAKKKAALECLKVQTEPSIS